MTAVAAIAQGGDKFGRAFGQNDVALNHDSVATKMHCLFRRDIDQIGDVFANCVLAVFVERGWKPKRAAIRGRTKTGVEMVKARIDKFH